MTIITVDLSGDVELIVRRDMVATVFRRVYEDDAGGGDDGADRRVACLRIQAGADP